MAQSSLTQFQVAIPDRYDSSPDRLGQHTCPGQTLRARHVSSLLQKQGRDDRRNALIVDACRCPACQVMHKLGKISNRSAPSGPAASGPRSRWSQGPWV